MYRFAEYLDNYTANPGGRLTTLAFQRACTFEDEEDRQDNVHNPNAPAKTTNDFNEKIKLFGLCKKCGKLNVDCICPPFKLHKIQPDPEIKDFPEEQGQRDDETADETASDQIISESESAESFNLDPGPSFHDRVSNLIQAGRADVALRSLLTAMSTMDDTNCTYVLDVATKAWNEMAQNGDFTEANELGEAMGEWGLSMGDAEMATTLAAGEKPGVGVGAAPGMGPSAAGPGGIAGGPGCASGGPSGGGAAAGGSGPSGGCSGGPA